MEAAVVCEELDVKDAQAVEFGEEIGSSIGGESEAVIGVGGHPVLEMAVGGVELEIIEGEIAVVERGSGEGGAGVEMGNEETQEQERERPGDGQVHRAGGRALGDLHSLFVPRILLRGDSSV